MSSQIDTCFSNLEALIRFQLEDNIQNHFEVDQKFKELIILICEIEDENQHGLYSYKYHTTYYSYLRAIGDTENANKQERLAKRCEKYTNTRTEGTQLVLYANCVVSNDINQDDNLKEILEELNQIRLILENELVEINVVDKLISDIQRTFEKLSRINKTFEVNGGSKEKEKNEEGMSSDLNTEIKLENDFNNAMALIRTNTGNQGISLFDRENIRNTINKNLINTTTNLFISLIHHQTSYEDDLRTKKDVNSYRNGSMVSGGISAIIMSSLIVPAGLVAAPVGLVAGACFLAGGVSQLFKKSKEMLREPITREKLNKIINKALSAYDDEKYQEFINALSEIYDDENHKRLLNCCDKIGITGMDNIVDTLQIHGFRSDGIAYLLILLGEVLGSGKIVIKGVTHAVLKVNAKTSFQLALNDKLVKEARELDECIRELRKSCQGKLKNSMLSTERTRWAQEYLDDSREMPFFSRLEEMRNVARINIAVLNIIENDKEAYKVQKKLLNKFVDL
ncbi:hypothetical protein C2G38_2149316 [Gigaspora rosea]|uniref:Uncharacterized protein n=1 Tax=Gigaspora rosea TaxID=44941 RepID=A0A397U0X6_9GLOM|nr:hypothetical protein C2G38_2149316 [Gigaspora rosea]